MRLLIPFQAVNQAANKVLDIRQPDRCSHCDTKPAAKFETHSLVIKADQIPHRQIGRKYRIQNRVLVRLPLCENCYLKEYLSSPDTYTKDDSPLGAQSRTREMLANTAGLLAGVGILLLTPFIPSVGILTVVKQYWYIVLGMGVALLAVAWGMQRSSQSAVQRKLEESHADTVQYLRADLWSESIPGVPDPATPAVTMRMENEGWMRDCARLNDWRLED